MRCRECGSKYKEKNDTFTMNYARGIGDITVTGYQYFKCPKCGDVLLSLEICKAMDEEIEKRKLEMTNRFTESNIRYSNHKDLTFPSCEHCNNYRQHCKKLERKLKYRKTGWSCSDYTTCHSWEQIKSEVVK